VVKAVEASLEPSSESDATQEQEKTDKPSQEEKSEVVIEETETVVMDRENEKEMLEDQVQEDPKGIVASEDIQKESSGFFSFLRNVLMFGGFVTAAFYWNQS